jgi:hypothetical protein
LQQQGIQFHRPLDGARESWQQLIDKVEANLQKERRLDPPLIQQLQRLLDDFRRTRG